MKYGIYDAHTKEIVLDAGDSLEDAKHIMKRLETEDGQRFFGANQENKEIWQITDFFEPIAKVELS